MDKKINIVYENPNIVQRDLIYSKLVAIPLDISGYINPEKITAEKSKLDERTWIPVVMLMDFYPIQDIATFIEKYDLFFQDRFLRIKKCDATEKELALNMIATMLDEAIKGKDYVFDESRLKYGWLVNDLPNFDGISNSDRTTRETPNQRKERIKKFVNDAYANGRTKQSAYAELAKHEGCGIDNIKRIYKS